MAILNNNSSVGLLGAGADSGYQIAKSLRFDQGDGAYLSRTPSSTGDTKKFTYSGWAKKCDLADTQYLLAAISGGSPFIIGFEADFLYVYTPGGVTYSAQKLRDPSAWYHIVVAVDTDQSTDTNRVKIYINNVRVTEYNTVTHPAQGATTVFNTSAVPMTIGKYSSSLGSNFYLAEVNYIDGQQLDPSSFGETNADTGQWIPKEYAGTYGTNGFYLKFDGTDLGEDSSGNDNDFTATNLIQGFYSISSPNLPAWDHADTGWTKSNSDKNGTYTGSGAHTHIATSALSDGTTYHFFYDKKDANASGGWFFADTQNPSAGHADVLGGNSLGLRTEDTNIGTYGTYATANGTSSAADQITGFGGIDAKTVELEFVINRTVDKVWVRVAGDSTWIKGGDPTNTSSTPSFLLPDGDTIYFGHIGYDSPTYANFTTTAGDPLAIDVSTDSPTTFDDSDKGTGNYCTWNPLYTNANLHEGNLKIVTNAAAYDMTMGTFGMSSGKWYWEGTWVSGDNRGWGIGTQSTPLNDYLGWTGSWGYMYNGVKVKPSNSQSSYGNSFTIGDIISVAFDADNGVIWFAKNGTWQNSATTGEIAAGTTTNAAFTGLTSGPYFPYTSNQASSTGTKIGNFGQQAFSYTPPSGFKALNTYNLPDPTIKDPSKHINISEYTGTGASGNAVTGVGFQPDMVWLERRASAIAPNIFNSVMGVSKALYAGYTSPEDPATWFAFTSDGYTLSGTGNPNVSSASYTSTNWLAASADTSVSAGDLTDSLYNDDQTWSTYGTASGTQYGSYVWADVFDNVDLTTLNVGSAVYGPTYKWTFTSPVAVTSSVAIKTWGLGNIVLNDGESDEVTLIGGREYHHTITDTSLAGASLKNILLPTGTACYIHGVFVDGKQLVDTAAVPTTPSLASTYRANTDAGFSIVSYTGTGANATIAHGLNAVPSFAWFKNREDHDSWFMYHQSLGNTHYMKLDAQTSKTDDATAWNDTTPTTTVMSIGSNNVVNGSTDEIIAFIWSEVEGYSKFGSYTGNGSADGPFVYCGFRPAYIMLRNADDASQWSFHDHKREGYNETNHWYQYPIDTESSVVSIDILSNGFKLRSSLGWRNDTNDMHIFAAFAESPFKYANAR